MDKEKLEKYCEDGVNTYAISKLEKVSQTTIVYWLKKFGLTTRGWSNINKEELIEAVKESKSYCETFLKLKLTSTSGNYKLLKRLIKKFNIDATHFLSQSEIMIRVHDQKKISNKNIFVANSNTSRGIIKKIIIKNNLLEYKCILCGQDEWWKNNRMSLILDHKNGINNDHRLENLRFVCPNCNSTLPTHCRKNKCTHGAIG